MGRRRYKSWSGNPVGGREDTRQCAAAVESRAKGRKGMQCAIPRGYGEGGQFCHRHAEKLAAGDPVHVPEERGAPCT